MDISNKAQTIALEWNAYCKKIESFVCVSSSGNYILLQYQTQADTKTFYNKRVVSLTESGFDIDGILYSSFDMPEIISDDIDDHLRDWAKKQDALERRRRRI